MKQFQEHFGKLWLCQKEFVPEFVGAQPEKKEEKKQEKPKEQKKKEEKPKEQPKKKEEKKEVKEEVEDDMPKKKSNPLDLLPKSPFNPEDFKREICNTDDKLAVLKKLWANFDTEGWSLWKVHYIKYEGNFLFNFR